MDFFDVFIYLSIFGGFLMAFSLGANDAANAMASAVGAKALSMRQAVAIAALMNLVGAIFLGGAVVATISQGIVDAKAVADPRLICLGLFAALLTSGFFVLVSTLSGYPVSSTHAVVGGMMGYGLVAAGVEAVKWSGLIGIFVSWVLSPFIGGLIAYLIYLLVRKTTLHGKDIILAVTRWCPIWIGFTAVVIVLEVVLDSDFGDQLVKESPTLAVATVVFFALFVWSQGRHLVAEHMARVDQQHEAVENIFRRLQAFTSSYVALAHGSNDVANAFGPVLGIYLIAKYHNIAATSEGATWLLVLGGVGIAIGTASLGHRVIATVGEGITKLNNTRGYSVDFSLATTVLLCSQLGLPVSSTTVAVGAVTGVGLSQGRQAVNLKALAKIMLVWVLTVPISGGVAALFFWVLKTVFY